MESELRAQITEAQAASLKASMQGWSRSSRVTDIVFGRCGVNSMQEDGWIIRLRRSDEKRRLEYKSSISTSSASWEELGIGVDNLAIAAKILIKVGLKPELVIDRQRSIRKVQGGTLTLDEVKFLGRFLEVETDGDARDLQAFFKRLGDVEVLQELSFDAPPYGHLLRQKRMNDQRIVRYEQDAILALMKNEAVPEWHLDEA